jgi:putative membrane protein
MSGLSPLSWTSFLDWQARPVWLLFSAVALTTYFTAVVVARRRRVPSVPAVRVASFVAGILLLLFTVSSAINLYAMSIFWDHMIEHLLLIMVVPALLVLGHPITAVRAAASTAGRESAVDALVQSWPVHTLTHPLVGLGLYTAVIVGTHFTGFMDAMATHGWLMGAEQWLYLSAGYVFLLPLLGDEPLRSRLPYLGRLGLLMLAMAPDTLVGIVLLQTTHDMFPIMEGAHPAWAPAPVDDLHIGGGLMCAAGDGLMMLLAVGVTLAMISHPESDLVIGRRLESVRRTTLTHQVDLGGGRFDPTTVKDVDEDEGLFDAYNQMLARLNTDRDASPGGR